MDDKSLNSVRKKLLEFRNSRDWEQFHDGKNLALSLSLEASEVLELFQWTKDNDIQEGKLDELQDELSDVFLYTILIAEKYDIDLIDSALKKIDKNIEKYPVDKSKGSSKKYDEL